VEKIVGDPYDDVWDALRYAAYSHHDPERKPLALRVNGRVSLILKGDEERGIPPNPTLAAFAYNRIWRQEVQEEEPTPIYNGGNLRRRIRAMQRRRGWRG
jgi:hypothetical protein